MSFAYATAPPGGEVAPTMTEPDLIRAAIAGDEVAREQLVRAYYPRMRRWALLETGDPSLAEDVVQDALVRWIRYGHTCDPDRPLATWVRTLVRNAARDRLRRRRGLLRFLPWTEERDPGPPLDRQVDLSRSARRALEGLARLTPRQREVVDLCDLQGLSGPEAADLLDLSPAAVRVHLHEGRKRLKKHLSESVRDTLEAE